MNSFMEITDVDTAKITASLTLLNVIITHTVLSPPQLLNRVPDGFQQTHHTLSLCPINNIVTVN